MVALTLALGASIAWGTSDFLGGLASRRLPVIMVLLGAQLTGLVLAVAVWLVAGAQLGAEAVALGGAAGLAELLGFACLYRGLAVGAMTVVAPVAALAAVLPVAVSVSAGAQIAALEAAGMLLAVAGAGVSAAEPGRRAPRGAGLGLGAALCFGAFFVLLGDASHPPAAVLSGKVAAIVTLVAVLAARRAHTTRRRPAAEAARPDSVERRARPGRPDVLAIAALGALDVAANLAYGIAAAGGADATVAVLASLDSIATVVLARALLHERLGALRLTGVVAALGGVALISAS